MEFKFFKEDLPLVLTASHIAEIMLISKPTVYQLMNEPDFPILKIGKCRRVTRDAFFKWLEKRSNSAC
jgi:excisionase family DNA binding protein